MTTAASTRSPATASVEPIRATVTVEAPAERAFDVFARRFDAWWPRTHKIGAGDLAEGVLEPWEGGRWYERDTDGSECEWGRVLVFEPPHRLVLAWQISAHWGFDPDLVTEVEVNFIAEGEGRTRVTLEHRDLERYGDAAAEVRASIGSEGGWPGILCTFAREAAA